MESEVFTPLLEQFMLTPLVCWVRSLMSHSNTLIPPIKHPPPPPRSPLCVVMDDPNTSLSLTFQVKTVGQPSMTDGTRLSEYVELVDGIYLNEIMLEM